MARRTLPNTRNLSSPSSSAKRLSDVFNDELNRNPVLDQGETYPHHNLYFIQSDDWDLEVLGGLLLSAVGQFLIESCGVRMRGGHLRFQAQYLRRIRVPDPQRISEVPSRALVDAFRTRDRNRATQVALDVYGIEKHELERALEY
jgi:hypothetical protein